MTKKSQSQTPISYLMRLLNYLINNVTSKKNVFGINNNPVENSRNEKGWKRKTLKSPEASYLLSFRENEIRLL